jgi:hypothetical protein
LGEGRVRERNKKREASKLLSFHYSFFSLLFDALALLSDFFSDFVSVEDFSLVLSPEADLSPEGDLSCECD